MKLFDKINLKLKKKNTITRFWWWNLKIKFEIILEWENLSREKSLSGKNRKVFQNHLKFLTKSSLVTLVQLINLSCTVSVIPCTITQITQNFISYVLIFVGNVLMT